MGQHPSGGLQILIVGGLGSLPGVVDYTTSLERQMYRHGPPERGMPPKTEN